MTSSSKNEGEGSRSAARAYNKDTRDFIKSGKVEQSAEKARDAVEGNQADELEKAEDKGRAPARK